MEDVDEELADEENKTRRDVIPSMFVNSRNDKSMLSYN